MVPCDPAELKDFVQFKPSSKIRFLQLAADPTRGWGPGLGIELFHAVAANK